MQVGGLLLTGWKVDVTRSHWVSVCHLSWHTAPFSSLCHGWAQHTCFQQIELSSSLGHIPQSYYMRHSGLLFIRLFTHMKFSEKQEADYNKLNLVYLMQEEKGSALQLHHTSTFKVVSYHVRICQHSSSNCSLIIICNFRLSNSFQDLISPNLGNL